MVLIEGGRRKSEAVVICGILAVDEMAVGRENIEMWESSGLSSERLRELASSPLPLLQWHTGNAMVGAKRVCK